MRPTVFRFALLLLLGATAWAGCGDPLSLLPAVFPNRVDTLAMWAASRTPVPFPSAYVIAQLNTARLDQVSNFDFLYDENAAGERYFLPLGALVNTGTTAVAPGFQASDIPFDDITVALQQGYVSRDTVPVRIGDVFYVRSAVDPNCGLGIPYYAKLEVLGFDDTEHKVALRILGNINCGYRGLGLGLPKK